MSRSPVSLWFDTMEAAWNAAITIEARFALIGAAAARGAFLSEPEVWRMGPEKVAAFASGMTAASLAAARQMQRAALDPARLSAAMYSAAVGPAHKKVRANAKRLSRRRRSR